MNYFNYINLLNNKYVNDITDYFKFNRKLKKFILPLMKSNRFQNTIFFKGPKLYNLIMFNNILKTIRYLIRKLFLYY